MCKTNTYKLNTIIPVQNKSNAIEPIDKLTPNTNLVPSCENHMLDHTSIVSDDTNVTTNPPNTPETITHHSNPVHAVINTPADIILLVHKINDVPNNIQLVSNVVPLASTNTSITHEYISVSDPKHDTYVGTLGHISDSPIYLSTTGNNHNFDIASTTIHESHDHLNLHNHNLRK